MKVTLKNMQEEVREMSFIKGWSKESLDVRLKFLQSEVDEVIDAIEKGDKKELGYELHDVIWNVLDIANRFGIDMSLAWLQKENEVANRVEVIGKHAFLNEKTYKDLNDKIG